VGSWCNRVYIFDVYMGVLHMGSVLRYMFGNIYIGVLSLEVEDQTFISVHVLLWGWAEMKFSAGTLIAKRVDRVNPYKESKYVCHRLYR